MDWDIIKAVGEGLGLGGGGGVWEGDAVSDGERKVVTGVYTAIETKSRSRHSGRADGEFTAKWRRAELSAGCTEATATIFQRIGEPCSVEVSAALGEMSNKELACLVAMLMTVRGLVKDWDKEGYSGKWRDE